MVIPGWRYLVSGGTTGQALTKISGADGDYQWSTVAAVPGGSDTQIQYNNAGAFAGSADLVKSATGLDIGNTTGDGYAARLGVKATGNGTIFVASDDGGIPYFTVQQLTGNHPFITFGIDVAGNFTNFLLDDSAKQIGFYTPLGVCQLGDWQSNGNGSQVAVDDANQKTTSNVKHEMSNGSGTVTIQLDAATGTWTFTLPVDDGDSGDVLTTDGSGNTSWVAPSGGSGLTSPQVLSRSLGS